MEFLLKIDHYQKRLERNLYSITWSHHSHPGHRDTRSHDLVYRTAWTSVALSLAIQTIIAVIGHTRRAALRSWGLRYRCLCFLRVCRHTVYSVCDLVTISDTIAIRCSLQNFSIDEVENAPHHTNDVQ